MPGVPDRSTSFPYVIYIQFVEGEIGSCVPNRSLPLLVQLWDAVWVEYFMESYRTAASNAARPGRLNAAFVRTVNRPGVYGDQHGLRLRVYKSRKRQSVSKQWIWRGTVNGTRRDIGLGGFPYVSLAEARQTAFEYRKTARAGCDPVTLRRRPDVPTFAQAAEIVIAIHREGWKGGGKSEAQWRASLRDYALPKLGRKGVDEITTADVMAVLIPHWHTKTETIAACASVSGR